MKSMERTITKTLGTRGRVTMPYAKPCEACCGSVVRNPALFWLDKDKDTKGNHREEEFTDFQDTPFYFCKSWQLI